jgi:magnesium chelatase family protein
MRAAMTRLNLSARAFHCILKLARTVADLTRCEEIQSVYLVEVLQCNILKIPLLTYYIWKGTC